MPQVDIDGANSKVSADTIRGQSGTTVTIQSGHNLVGSGSGLTALPAANITGTLPAISGANLTNLPASGFTLGTEQATTSGTTITFGSIPSGTKMIIISLNGVSNDGTVNVLVRLGDAGGLETSGYIGASVVAYENGNVLGAGDSTGFPIKNRDASTFHCGTVICTLVDSTTFDWVMSVSESPAGDNGVVGGGRKTLSAELTQVALYVNSGAFDAGTANIMYI